PLPSEGGDPLLTTASKPGRTSKCERPLQHRAAGLLARTLLAGEPEPQTTCARRPQRHAGAQHRFVARKADAIDGHPIVEAGKAGVESIAVLVQRVPPRGAAVELHPHAVGEAQAALSTHAKSSLQSPDRATVSLQSESVAARFRERALAQLLVARIHERRDLRRA